MIFQKFEDISLKNFPVIIFGSGPAGITIALELERKKISSLIIEAGQEKYSDDSQDFYNGEIIGDDIDLSDRSFRNAWEYVAGASEKTSANLSAEDLVKYNMTENL